MGRQLQKQVRAHLRDLQKHGYDIGKTVTVKARHAALRKAAVEFGWAGVYAKLLLLSNYTKTRQPELADVYQEDVLYTKPVSTEM